MQQEALNFAMQAHEGQKRKYHDEPYIEHPKRVAELVKTVNHSDEMICAAYLHDVVEDTPVRHKEIEKRFGSQVAQLVYELTDQFVKEAYPDLNRKVRKEKEAQRQSGISKAAKTIKLADVIDNTRDITKNDKGFAKKYVREMEKLVEALQGGDFKLLMLACYEIQKAKYELKL